MYAVQPVDRYKTKSIERMAGGDAGIVFLLDWLFVFKGRRMERVYELKCE